MSSDITEDTKLQTLYDHYKDTYFHIKGYIRQRDWLFLLIVILVAIMLFQLVDPLVSGETLSDFVSHRLELKQPIDISIIGSVIWFSLLVVVVRYYQRVILIENQYNYLHQLETKLAPYYDNGVFNREGENYKKQRTLFSDWAWRLYTIFSPILLLLVTFIKIVSEFLPPLSLSVLHIFDAAACAGIWGFTVFYLLSIHLHK